MNWQDYWDEVLRHSAELEEKAVLRELEESRKLIPVVLIANPKYNSEINAAINKGADIVVMWSRCCEEDKVYQVIDPVLREQIIEQCRG